MKCYKEDCLHWEDADICEECVHNDEAFALKSKYVPLEFAGCCGEDGCKIDYEV